MSRTSSSSSWNSGIGRITGASVPPDHSLFAVEERARTRQALYFLTIAFIGMGAITLVQTAGVGMVAAVWTLAIEILLLFACGWLARQDKLEWAGKIICFSVLASGLLLMGVTRVGFREVAMQLFPLVLIIAAILLDRLSYLAFSALAVTGAAALGIFLIESGHRMQYSNVASTTCMLLITAVAAGLLVQNLRITLARSLESERRYREILDNVRIAACIVDTKGVLLYCNEYLLHKLKRTAGEVLGRPYTNLVAQEHHDIVSDVIATSLATDQVVPFHVAAIVAPDGQQRWFEWVNATLRDAHGAIIAFASIGVDVTDQRELQERYLQSQKLESLGRLSGAVAHDFNNLLTVIRGYGGLLLNELKYDAPSRTSVEHICDAAEKASDLTHQLLAFSRKQSIEPRPLDLNQTVKGLKSMMKLLLGPNIELFLRLDESLGPVMADPGQLNQVLINLAANARDAMPTGGRFAIETSAGACDSGPCATLRASDTGTGMSQEVQRRIFEPFFTTKPEGKGTGLGLATVYGIVKQLHGVISVESEPGRGAAFTILLPLAEPRSSQLAAMAAKVGHHS